MKCIETQEEMKRCCVGCMYEEIMRNEKNDIKMHYEPTCRMHVSTKLGYESTHSIHVSTHTESNFKNSKS